MQMWQGGKSCNMGDAGNTFDFLFKVSHRICAEYISILLCVCPCVCVCVCLSISLCLCLYLRGVTAFPYCRSSMLHRESVDRISTSHFLDVMWYWKYMPESVSKKYESFDAVQVCVVRDLSYDRQNLKSICICSHEANGRPAALLCLNERRVAVVVASCGG